MKDKQRRAMFAKMKNPNYNNWQNYIQKIDNTKIKDVSQARKVVQIKQMLADEKRLMKRKIGPDKATTMIKKLDKQNKTETQIIDKLNKTYNIPKKDAKELIKWSGIKPRQFSDKAEDVAIERGIERNRNITIPKNSASKGFVDEGISDALEKPKTFKYSEAFLKKWYGDKKAY